MKVRIATSILAAVLLDIRAGNKQMKQAPVDSIQLHLMDGHFVPSIFFGPQITLAARAHSPKSLTAQISPNNCEKYYRSGADTIVVGSGIFNQPNPIEVVQNFRKAAENH